MSAVPSVGQMLSPSVSLAGFFRPYYAVGVDNTIHRLLHTVGSRLIVRCLGVCRCAALGRCGARSCDGGRWQMA